jgi:uncharacterized membrane protein
MTPGQLCTTFVMLGGVSLGVSMAWALSGAWVVLPFVLLEWVVLALAFLVYARHATDHERVTIVSIVTKSPGSGCAARWMTVGRAS